MGTDDNIESIIADIVLTKGTIHLNALCRQVKRRKTDVIATCYDLIKRGILKKETQGTKILISYAPTADFYSFGFMDEILEKLERIANSKLDVLQVLKPITKDNLDVIRKGARQDTRSDVNPTPYRVWITKKARRIIESVSRTVNMLDLCINALTFAEDFIYAAKLQKAKVIKRKERCVRLRHKIITRLFSLTSDETGHTQIFWKINAYRTLIDLPHLTTP